MTALSGMGEICRYVNRSEATVLKWIRESGFPARKLSGIWESDSGLVDDWKRDQIQNGDSKKPSKKPAKKKPSKKRKKANG